MTSQQIIQKSQKELQEMVDLARRGTPQDFSYQDMRHVSFMRSGSYPAMKGSNFSYANLSKVDLDRFNLTKCNFTAADLSGADLQDGFVCNANFTDANLSGARLELSNLEGANFTNANLSNVKFANARFYPSCVWNGADLSGAYYGYTLHHQTGEKDEKIMMTRPPLKVALEDKRGRDLYVVTFFDRFIRIGCQVRSYKEWLELTHDEIKGLDGSDALEMNRLHRETIIQLAEQHGCTKD
ncbi:MAG TPA: pentapeptide repeat-containing protein [Phormidium sp.]